VLGLIDCGCKGKKKHQTHLGDEAVEICLDCAEALYKELICLSIKKLKGVAENDVLRATDGNRQALCQQKEN